MAETPVVHVSRLLDERGISGFHVPLIILSVLIARFDGYGIAAIGLAAAALARDARPDRHRPRAARRRAARFRLRDTRALARLADPLPDRRRRAGGDRDRGVLLDAGIDQVHEHP